MASNNRQHPRIDARIQVQLNTGDEFVQCYSRNISKGGILLETETLPDPNATVELVLKLDSIDPETESTDINLQARVVRLMSTASGGKTIHKVALQFLEIPPHLQVQLDRLYKRHTQT